MCYTMHPTATNNYKRNVAQPVLRYHRNRNYGCGMASFSKNFSSPSHLIFQQCFHFSRRYITLIEQSRRMHVTVCSFTHCSQGRVATSAFSAKSYWRDLHVKTGHLCTGDMECSVTVSPVALDAGSGAAAPTDAARQASAGRWNSLQPIDRFKEHMVCEANFWDPQCTSYMSPPAITGLLECTTAVWTQTTIDRTWRWL